MLELRMVELEVRELAAHRNLVEGDRAFYRAVERAFRGESDRIQAAAKAVAMDAVIEAQLQRI